MSAESQYHSGEDVVVEFLDFTYGFSREDFTERAVAAGIRLDLLPQRELDTDEAADLADFTAQGHLDEARSDLGRHLQAHAAELESLHADGLVYWLRKLIFRGAWLDHRVKAGLLDVAFEEGTGTFSYRMPSDQVPVLEAASVPSWSSLQFTD
jgi:hypothetical protein